MKNYGDRRKRIVGEEQKRGQGDERNDESDLLLAFPVSCDSTLKIADADDTRCWNEMHPSVLIRHPQADKRKETQRIQLSAFLSEAYCHKNCSCKRRSCDVNAWERGEDDERKALKYVEKEISDPSIIPFNSLNQKKEGTIQPSPFLKSLLVLGMRAEQDEKSGFQRTSKKSVINCGKWSAIIP